MTRRFRGLPSESAALFRSDAMCIDIDIIHDHVITAQHAVNDKNDLINSIAIDIYYNIQSVQ